MAIQFVTTSQVTALGGIKCAVYGDAGMGKTALAATAPKPLILAVEAGLLSLRKENIERIWGVGTPGITYDIPVMIINTADDLNAAYDWCANTANHHYFDTAYLDSVSEIAEVVLARAKAGAKDPRQAYGEVIDKMGTLIRGFVKIPGKNVVMTAKMEPYKDELSGVTRQIPMMPGAKLGPKFAYEFDEVFRMGASKDDKGKPYRFLQTQPDLQYVAKDRSGALAAVEYPHLTYLFNKILGVT